MFGAGSGSEWGPVSGPVAAEKINEINGGAHGAGFRARIIMWGLGMAIAAGDL